MLRFNAAVRYGVAGLVLFCLQTRTWAQGSLTPSGPPGMTMRTLTQVEPRTPVNVMAGVPGQCKALIDKPGSYYLTGNITGASGMDGIRITTDSVTLDLNGFSLIGVPGSQTGIYAFSRSECVIRNGAVHDWGMDGVYGGFEFRIESLMVTRNGLTGIRVDSDSIVTGCIVKHNQSTGIYLGSGAILRECVSSGNEGSGMVLTSGGGQVLNCRIVENKLGGIVQSNGVGWLIAGNTIYHNEGSASISLVQGSLVLNNMIAYNVNGRGISTTMGLHRFEGNHIIQHDVGIFLGNNPGKNVMVNNSVVGSTTANYQGNGGNNAASAGPLSTTAAATNPYGNIDIP